MHKKFLEQYEIIKGAYMDMIDCMNELGLDWHVYGGTLMALLRYGAHFGKIGDRYDLPDGDIDFCIGVDSEEDYKEKKRKIDVYLKKKNWLKCRPHHDCMEQCFYRGKFDTPLNWPIFIDFFAYRVDGEYVYSMCESGYPFQAWGGKISKELMYPMVKCKYYDREVPCPKEYIYLLKSYNDCKYKEGSIAYPDTYMTKIHNAWWERYLNETGPDKPLSERELKDLLKYAKDLYGAGYASFYELMQDPKELEMQQDAERRAIEAAKEKKKQGGKKNMPKK